jgi:hypothetical protein
MFRPNFFSVLTSVAGLGTAFCLGLEHGVVKDLSTIASTTLVTWGGNSLFELIRSRAVRQEEMLNHHLQKALKEAHDWALAELRAEFVAQHPTSPETLADLDDYLAGLRQLGASEWMDQLRPELAKEGLFSFVEGDYARVGELVSVQVRQALGPGADPYGLPPYFFFVLEHLPAKMSYAFREKIKKGGEAKNALDLLYFEALRRGMDQLLAGQAGLAQGQAEQRRLLEEIRGLQGKKKQGLFQGQRYNDPTAQAWAAALDQLEGTLEGRLGEIVRALGAQQDQLASTKAAVLAVGGQVVAENQATRRTVGRFLWFGAALLGLAYVGVRTWVPQPLALTVRAKDLWANPELPLTGGRATLHYGAKTETVDLVGQQAHFAAIPPSFAGARLALVVEVPGFAKVDTTFALEQDLVEVGLRPDQRLAKIFGVVTFQGRPVDSVRVSVLDLATWTGPDGRFVLQVPPQQQRKKQRVRATKPGFAIWDYESPVLGQEVSISLEQ